MYVGSVRFFRHMIVGFVCFLLVLGFFGTLYFGILSSNYRSQLDGLLTEIPPISVEGETPISHGPGAASTGELTYQELYPDMYCEVSSEPQTAGEVFYLTFDDGPSVYTGEVLDLLAANNIKATFFVVVGNLTEEDAALLRRIVDEGHTLGIHSYSHNYAQIYASPEAFLEDFYKAYTAVYAATGYRPNILRFPGGSINNYNRAVYQPIIAELTRRGFIYYDWNISAEDASSLSTTATVTNSLRAGIASKKRGIILLHDTRYSSVQALEGLLKEWLEQGYIFEPLTPAVKPITFTYG